MISWAKVAFRAHIKEANRKKKRNNTQTITMQSTEQNIKHKSSHFRNAKCPLNKMNEWWQMFNICDECARVYLLHFFFLLSLKKKIATWWQNGNRFLETNTRSSALGSVVLLLAAVFIWHVCAFNCERQYINQVCTGECCFNGGYTLHCGHSRLQQMRGEHTRCYTHLPEQKKWKKQTETDTLNKSKWETKLMHLITKDEIVTHWNLYVAVRLFATAAQCTHFFTRSLACFF